MISSSHCPIFMIFPWTR